MSRIDPPKAIFRKWTHSYEEDTQDVTVYRADDFPFPRSRGRAAIEFQPDGKFVDWPIGPADVSRGISGHWQSEAPGRIRAEFEGDARKTRIYEILYCDKDVLRLRVIPAR